MNIGVLEGQIRPDGHCKTPTLYETAGKDVFQRNQGCSDSGVVASPCRQVSAWRQTRIQSLDTTGSVEKY